MRILIICRLKAGWNSLDDSTNIYWALIRRQASILELEKQWTRNVNSLLSWSSYCNGWQTDQKQVKKKQKQQQIISRSNKCCEENPDWCAGENFVRGGQGRHLSGGDRIWNSGSEHSSWKKYLMTSNHFFRRCTTNFYTPIILRHTVKHWQIYFCFLVYEVVV